MKIRNGFVSNSSSSSFIIGVGIATDNENIKRLKEFGNRDVEVVPLVEVISGEHTSWDGSYNSSKDTYTMESFTYSEAIVKNLCDKYEINNDAVLVKFYHSSGDDCDFWNEDYDEYDYDIDFDFFDDRTQDAVSKCESLTDEGTFNWCYGAGRNG